MTTRLLSLLLLCLATFACQNNGHIGDLFGSWLLEDMTVDGETPSDFNPDETFWSFQSSVLQITRVDSRFERDDRWGTWSQDDNHLLLNFTHHDVNSAPGEYPYLAPAWLGFPPNSLISLSYIARTSTHMILQWQSADGKNYIYSLRKIW